MGGYFLCKCARNPKKGGGAVEVEEGSLGDCTRGAVCVGENARFSLQVDQEAALARDGPGNRIHRSVKGSQPERNTSTRMLARWSSEAPGTGHIQRERVGWWGQLFDVRCAKIQDEDPACGQSSSVVSVFLPKLATGFDAA